MYFSERILLLIIGVKACDGGKKGHFGRVVVREAAAACHISIPVVL